MFNFCAENTTVYYIATDGFASFSVILSLLLKDTFYAHFSAYISHENTIAFYTNGILHSVRSLKCVSYNNISCNKRHYVSLAQRNEKTRFY